MPQHASGSRKEMMGLKQTSSLTRLWKAMKMRSRALPGATLGLIWQLALVTKASGFLTKRMAIWWSISAWECFQATHKMSNLWNGILREISFSLQVTMTPSNHGTSTTQLMNGCASSPCEATFLPFGASTLTQLENSLPAVVKTKLGSFGVSLKQATKSCDRSRTLTLGPYIPSAGQAHQMKTFTG